MSLRAGGGFLEEKSHVLGELAGRMGRAGGAGGEMGELAGRMGRAGGAGGEMGELAGRMARAGLEGRGRRDSSDQDFPPPPPVFQTYAAQLLGQEEDDLPPPPPPPPPSSGAKLSSSSPLKPSILASSPRPYKPPPSTLPTPTSLPSPRPKTSPSPPPKTWLSCPSPGFSPRSVSSSSLLTSPSPVQEDARIPSSTSPSPSPSSMTTSSTSPGGRRDSPVRRESAWDVSPEHSNTGLTSSRRMSQEVQEGGEVMAMLNTPNKSCYSCNLPVDPQEGCTALGHSYHRACLCCTECQTQLEGKFSSRNDRPLCADCCQGQPCLPCRACGSPVGEGEGVLLRSQEKGQEQGQELGRSYHSRCLLCSMCGVSVGGGKVFTREGELLCGDCGGGQDTVEECGLCHQDITGDCLLSGGTHYHHHCMTCAICGEGLRGTYFTYMDKLICEKDYKETQKLCSECGVAISGTYYTLDNDKIVCEADYRSQLGSCQKCGLVVEGRIMKVSGSLYHPDCFTCSVCNKSMVGVPFSLDDDREIYCSEDYQRKHASMCSACNKPILPPPGESSAPRLRALGQDFHPNCFCCKDCSLVLDSRKPGSECYPLDQVPLCKSCNLKRQR